MKGIRCTIRTAQTGKDPLLSPHIRALLAACPGNLAGTRDKAFILTGFAGAFRRSELAAIDFRDLTSCEEGLIVDLRRSKTDQAASGRKVGVPWGSEETTCPVRALRCYLDEAGITNGAVFRSIDRHHRISLHGLNKDSVGYILKQAARRAGMQTKTLGGHSLRSGHVTQSARNGIPEYLIMLQTGHRSSATLRRYIRMVELFRENAAAGLGI